MDLSVIHLPAEAHSIVKDTDPIKTVTDTTLTAMYIVNNRRVSSVTQRLFFNKATGKKVSLTTQPARIYRGDSAFTLVNGVQNEKGLDKPREFLGFNGTDCEAIIDLGSAQQINNVKAHVFEQIQSWIYRPKYMQISASADNISYSDAGMTDVVQFNSNDKNGVITVQLKHTNARYVKIKIGNFGIIPENNAGAGNKAWLFVDEIEVN